MARQLTIRTWDIYSKFQPLEFFKTAWSKPSTWHLSPNLLAAINFFNHVSLWVGTMIVTTEKVRERAKIMNRCVKIAQVRLPIVFPRARVCGVCVKRENGQPC